PSLTISPASWADSPRDSLLGGGRDASNQLGRTGIHLGDQGLDFGARLRNGLRVGLGDLVLEFLGIDRLHERLADSLDPLARHARRHDVNAHQNGLRLVELERRAIGWRLRPRDAARNTGLVELGMSFEVLLRDHLEALGSVQVVREELTNGREGQSDDALNFTLLHRELNFTYAWIAADDLQ